MAKTKPKTTVTNRERARKYKSRDTWLNSNGAQELLGMTYGVLLEFGFDETEVAGMLPLFANQYWLFIKH